MSKHTPGPWKIDMTTMFDCNYSRASAAIVGANGAPVVLFDPSEGEYKQALDPDSADAHLISAAPDLLDALDLLLRYSLSHPIHTDQSQFGNVYDKARAAIAKARGEK
jgi:hypothetical protein